jgi:hypothetical protein
VKSLEELVNGIAVEFLGATDQVDQIREYVFTREVTSNA